MLSRQRSRCVPWVEEPAAPPGWYPVFRAISGEEHTFTALVDEIVGVPLHFNGERSVACVGKENGCRFCKRKPMVEFYTLGFRESDSRIYICAISNGALLWCSGYKQGLFKKGRKFTMGRVKDNDNGKCWLTLGEYASYASRLPEPRPLRECVSRMLGMESGEPQEQDEEEQHNIITQAAVEIFRDCDEEGEIR